MEELLILRQYIEEKQYDQALELVAELEEMSKEDKLNKIFSYAVILLLHLVKQEAEKRTTRSWDFSIYNSIKEIKKINKRRKSGGYYATEEELKEIIIDAFDTAIRKASLEVFEGKYSADELMTQIDSNLLQSSALKLIL
jgi:6-pyruvoyl-tetrahydropterin synthase